MALWNWRRWITGAHVSAEVLNGLAASGTEGSAGWEGEAWAGEAEADETGRAVSLAVVTVEIGVSTRVREHTELTAWDDVC